MSNIEHILNTYSLYLLAFGTVALIVLAYIALKAKKIGPEGKKTLFSSIVIAAIVPTLVMAGSTIYVNTTSSSGGPVHWHADLEVWNCGVEVDLKDPKGFSNKIGTATLHEHNDKRIHLEGVVMDEPEASLGNFFHVIDGELTPNSFNLPTNNGQFSAQNGNDCNGSSGEVQVFVYKTDKDNYYTQEKLASPAEYIMAPFSSVPTGDCIIVEFDAPKEKTDRMCRSYKVALEIGKLKGERR